MAHLSKPAALLVLVAFTAAATADEPWTAAEIAPAQVREQAAADAASLVILDVRSPEEFAAGHVPGAINIPYDEVPARLAELEPSKDKEIVVYCRSGKRAAKALASLRDAGFTRLLHLTGDMPAWTESAKAE